MKSKSMLFPGLSLFLCFCLLTGTGKLSVRFGSNSVLFALAEIISFALPVLLLMLNQKDKKKIVARIKPSKQPKGAIGFAVMIGLAIAVLSLFLNLLIYQIAGLAGSNLSTEVLRGYNSNMSGIAGFFIIVIISAIAEECYLRGALLAVHEKNAGTMVCILVNGIAFAMLHGDMLNFAGPLFAGMAYAYLTYVFKNIWPAIIAHMTNNLYYLFVVWFTETYAAFGIWKYFAAINGIILLALLYIALRKTEKLLIGGRIPHFEKGAGLYDMVLIIRNPGMIAFLLAFIVKAVLHWI